MSSGAGATDKLYSVNQGLNAIESTILSGGSLGSQVDEERS